MNVLESEINNDQQSISSADMHSTEETLARSFHTLLRRKAESPIDGMRSLSRLGSYQENIEQLDSRGGSLSPSGSSTSGVTGDSHILNERVQCLESEKLALMVDHNNLIREFNKRMQSNLEEIRTLKEGNQSVELELTELRDLCCHLDDDRKKCRKLAKEWQKFGRHTVATLRSEVSAYQDRHNCLEARNAHLQQENNELRDLCLHLDEQRLIKEDSLEQNKNSLKYVICPECSSLRNGSTDNDNSKSENVSNLQNKVQQLEREKDMLHRLLMYGSKNRKEKKRVSFTFPDDDSSSTASELDMFDFPPTNFDYKSNFISEHHNGNYNNVINNHHSPLNSHGSISSMNSVGSQQNSHSSPLGYNEHDIRTKKSINELLYKHHNGTLNGNHHNNNNNNGTHNGNHHNNNNNGGSSDHSNKSPPNLPLYEESVKYLEGSKSFNDNKIMNGEKEEIKSTV